MIEAIKKGLHLTLGAFAMSKEKAEKLIDELIKKGEAGMEEKPELVKKILERAQEQEKKVAELIDRAVQKAVEKAKIATKEDIENLKEKVDSIVRKMQ